ncbi:DUF1080 domain-containing protein [Cellulophaga sp. F20128]|uniref:3-keto-disaccharide hydrolase n=1 Tax=Cellulophaga sp. F20128 TaxID=2926413 RepID=UPI001FF35137|nr:DUF1080 domain-containing protein [Cellulophaga sp. F20128]MCK0157146.1 DUF1080 domain-containing protein [Cellulophaga sp. F20128]
MKVKLVYIVICMLLCACKSTVKEAGSEENVVSLFNGKNLDKWTGDSRIWSVEDGSIVGRTTDENKIEKNTFLIYEDSFADFELSFSYKIIGGNSGVQYRSKVIDNDLFVVGGYQADMEAGINYSGILYEEKGRGIIAKRGEKITIAEDGKKAIEQFVKSEEIQAIIKQEQWNTYKIVAKGNQLQHFINGHKTIDVTDNQLDKKSDAGILALQVHAGPNMVVYYTNIELKPILK